MRQQFPKTEKQTNGTRHLHQDTVCIKKLKPFYRLHIKENVWKKIVVKTQNISTQVHYTDISLKTACYSKYWGISRKWNIDFR